MFRRKCTGTMENNNDEKGPKPVPDSSQETPSNAIKRRIKRRRQKRKNYDQTTPQANQSGNLFDESSDYMVASPSTSTSTSEAKQATKNSCTPGHPTKKHQKNNESSVALLPQMMSNPSGQLTKQQSGRYPRDVAVYSNKSNTGSASSSKETPMSSKPLGKRKVEYFSEQVASSLQISSPGKNGAKLETNKPCSSKPALGGKTYSSAVKQNPGIESKQKDNNRKKKERKGQKEKKNFLPDMKNRKVLKEFYEILKPQKVVGLLRKQPDEIVEVLVHSPSWFEDFQTFVKKEKGIPTDLFEDLLKLLSKASESTRIEDLNKVYSELPDSLFLLKHMPYHLLQMATNTTPEGPPIVSRVIIVLTELLRKFPGCYDQLPMNVLKRIMEKFQLSAMIIGEKLLGDFNQLVEIHGELSKPKPKVRHTVHESAESKAKFTIPPVEEPPPNDFRTIPILPRHEDIFGDDNPYLRPNIVGEPYRDLEHYLDVHFRLLHEDFQAPLREGISVLVTKVEARKRESERKSAKGIGRIQDIYVYEGVKILNPKCERDGLLFRLKFDSSKLSRFTDWKTTKRFMNGSLLCLSKDNFETFFFATVAGRDEKKDLKKGELDIKILLYAHNHVSLDLNDVYLMAESRAYFEAYRHVLSGLQASKELPLQQYLVECRQDVDVPAYLRSGVVEYDFSCLGKEERTAQLASVLDSSRWPSSSYLGLNDSQLEALKTALTKELALIQGPPGTGKTYVGLKIAKILLANRKTINIGPILVVCYTNHALDQFLEGILDFSKTGIVRIGGRSSSERMEECSLKNFIRNRRRLERRTHSRHSESHQIASMILDKVKDELQKLVKNIEEVNEKLLPESHVRTVVKKDLLDCLLRDVDGYSPPYNEAILRWLELFSDDAEFNEDEVTVLVQETDQDEVFEDLEVECVQLTGRDFSLAGNIKTTTGGGILSRSLESPNILHRLFVSDEGYLTFEVTRESQNELFLVGETSIGDGEWHEVILTYEEQDGRIRLYVDQVCQAQNTGYKFYKYKENNEKICVGLNPFVDDPELNNIMIKELVYIPNAALTLNGITEPREDPTESTSSEVQLVSDAHFIQEQRLLEDDHDIEGFQSQSQSEPTILEKILRQGKDGQGGWTVVENKKSKLAKFTKKVKTELHRKDYMSLEDYEKVEDVWELKLNDRWRLYRRWIIDANKEYHWQMAPKQVEYEDAIEAFREEDSKEISHMLKDVSVIGMTTTGAAKRPKLLKGIGARIVIVEEAAEVLESHIVTSLTGECEHLILIGDHKQLRPTPNVYDLVKFFNFDVSLFERMIKSELHFECLMEQHRMRPEISQISRHIYPELKDHESVHHYDNISGVKHNVYFVHHDRLEEPEDDTKSHVNKHEARFLVALCKYFLQQGYKSSQITILTPYTGQLREIQKCTKNVLPRPRPGERSVRVTSIDNYQGEENDIVLLSLVRSNTRGNIGFVAIENRVCVALSRAKKGLYCIGNMNMIRKKNKLWDDIVKGMEKQGLVGPRLTLCCQMHDDNQVYVETAEDFQRAPNGGCTRVCMKALPCGHSCRKMCHPIDNDHVAEHKCRQPCTKFPCRLHPNRRCLKRCTDECSPCKELVWKTLPNCSHEKVMFCHEDPTEGICKAECLVQLECGHQCRNFCSEPCGPCQVPVEKPLPDCGHEMAMLCSADPKDVQCDKDCPIVLPCGHQCRGKCSRRCKTCREKVTKILAACGHQMELPCFKDPSEAICRLPCPKELPCGHPCTELCGMQCNQVCKFKCSKELSCGHACPDTCSDPCRPCGVVIEVTLKCGHAANIKCSQNPEKAHCSQPCSLLLDCGHKCSGYCSEKCVPCPVLSPKILPGCGHTVIVPCSKQLQSIKCALPCEKTLPECSHRCQKRCYEQCTPCRKMVQKTLPDCHHVVDVPCSMSPNEVSCPYPCREMLQCGHICTKNCSEACFPCLVMVPKIIPSCRHREYVPCSTTPEEHQCRSPCSRILACGHACSRECFQVPCGPCVSQELVTKRLPSCGHDNKVPCCEDPATFRCKQFRFLPLPCGHQQGVPCHSRFQRLSCKPRCTERGNVKCGPTCAKCLAKRLKQLPCGHKKQVACYKYNEDEDCFSCSSLFMKD